MDKLLQQYENNSQQQKLGMTTPEVVNKTTRRHLVVVPSSSKQYMVEKIPYFPYRPATDLRYLTGHTEPNSALIVDVDPQGAFRSILFVGDSDPAEEKWEGPKTKPEQVESKYGLDEGHYLSRLGQFLAREAQKDSDTVIWYDFKNPLHQKIHRSIAEAMMGIRKSEAGYHSPKSALHETRVIKSPAEVSLMRRTCRIASDSIADTMRKTWSSGEISSEAQAFATVDFGCRMRGASWLAYPPVVAAGDHATVIHYTANSHAPFDRNDMMLMDAGCEYEGYTSDITRTWPLSGGNMTTAQRLVFEAVHDVQTTLIETLREGHLGGRPLTIDSLYHQSQTLFAPHLVNMGILQEECDPGAARVVCSELCPHHVSHYLGMDVHDTPLVSRNIPLTPGMVITVEPGLYFPRTRHIKHLDHLNKRGSQVMRDFMGIGVRLEDDVLITANTDGTLSCEVLTESCPKRLQQLEKLAAE